CQHSAGGGHYHFGVLAVGRSQDCYTRACRACKSSYRWIDQRSARRCVERQSYCPLPMRSGFFAEKLGSVLVPSIGVADGFILQLGWGREEEPPGDKNGPPYAIRLSFQTISSRSQ